jgi:hypothetical protein
MTHDLRPANPGEHPMAPQAATSDGRSAATALTSAYAGLDPATITHRELVEILLEEKGWERSRGSGSGLCSYVSTWCKSLGLTPADPSQRSLSHGFDERLTAVTDNLASEKKSLIKNVRWAAKWLRQTYESIRTHGSLSLDFTEALNQALQARGWEAKHLCAAIGWKTGHGSIYGYVAGRQAPRWPQSLALVMRIEKALELPENTLVSRAFRRPQVIRLGNHNPIKYRTHQSRRTKSRYGLKKLPKQFLEFWLKLSDWRTQPKLRVAGKTYIPEFLLWTRDGTQKKYSANVRRFAGWLTRPKPTKPLSAMTEEERWEVGKGMKEKNIRLSHVFNIDLIWEFFEFLRARQHNQKYTQDLKHYVIFLNSLVNHPYSYVKAHPELASLFGKKRMSRPKWVAFTEAIHQRILLLSRDLRKARKGTGKQRSSDEPLIEIFNDPDPTELFLQAVDELTRRLPSKIQKITRSVQLRDIALIDIEMEQPLRARNLSELEIGSSLIRDSQSGLWRVLVPKENMKNKHSKYCQGVYCVLTEKTSSAIDRYLEEGRPNLKFANKTKLFLVPGPSGPKPKALETGEMPPDRFGVSPEGVYWIIRRRTEEVFGVGLGSNVFRHLLPTSILKDNPGAIDLCAAKLDNSPNTVRENYQHVKRSDHLAQAKAWYDQKQRKHEEARELKGPRG